MIYCVRLFSFGAITLSVLFIFFGWDFISMPGKRILSVIEHRCKYNRIFWFYWGRFLPMAVSIPKRTVLSSLNWIWAESIASHSDNGAQHLQENGKRNEFWHMWTNDSTFIWETYRSNSFHRIGSDQSIWLRPNPLVDWSNIVCAERKGPLFWLSNLKYFCCSLFPTSKLDVLTWHSMFYLQRQGLQSFFPQIEFRSPENKIEKQK